MGFTKTNKFKPTFFNGTTTFATIGDNTMYFDSAALARSVRARTVNNGMPAEIYLDNNRGIQPLKLQNGIISKNSTKLNRFTNKYKLLTYN